MGFIKIDRRILNWGWYDDPATKAVFLHLLLNANYEDGEYHGVEVKAGQVVFGRKKYSSALGLSERSVRTAIEHLHKTGEISTSKTTNKFTVITIEKWGMYQGQEQQTDQQSDQQAANKRPTTDRANGQQTTTSKKERNKNKETYNLQEEFDKLWDLYPKKSGKKDALRHYKAARKRGTTFDQVKAGIIAYKNYIEKTGTEMQYVKMGSSFFNQEAWESDWTVPAKPKSKVHAPPEPPKYKTFEPEPERKPVPMSPEQRKARDEILRGLSEAIKEA